MQTYYTIYKITNILNGKFYIGQHQTKDTNDLYMGSGTSIVNAVSKYGRNNFSKEILYIFESFDEMNVKEIEIVTDALVKNPLCYNQVPGGQFVNLGGKQTSKRSPEHCKKLGDINRGRKQDPIMVARRAKTCKDNRAKLTQEERNVRFGLHGAKNGFFNKHHLEITKQKIRDTIGDSRKGSKNANATPVELYGKKYGTKKECFTDLGISKKKLNQILGDLTMNKLGDNQCHS